MNKLKHEAGECPRCKAPIDEWGDSGLEDNSYYFRWSCKCGATGKEWHSLEFSEHILDDE